MDTRPTRVVMVSHNYFPYIGGIESMLAAICPMLRAKGIELSVLTRRSTPSPCFERIQNVPVYRFPINGPKIVSSPLFTLAALWMLRRLKPDIVHAHIMFAPATIGLFAKYLFKTKLVITVHRSGPAPFGEIERLRQKLFGGRRLDLFRRHTDRFVVISPDIETEMDEVGIHPSCRTYISNGIDPNRFAPLSAEDKQALRKTLRLPKGPIVIFSGRLSEEKRVHHLLSIWPEVQAAQPDAQLLIVGTGPEESRLRRTAGDGITFVGGVQDVKPYLQAADLFVLPSVAEGLSVAILEAMSTGLPVICTRLSSEINLVSHQKNGWMVPPDDVPALEKAVLELLSQPDLRKELGCRARAHVSAHFGLDAVTDQLLALYKALQET